MSASWDRRKFIRYTSGSVGFSLLPASLTYALPVHLVLPSPVAKEPLRISVNGTVYQVEVDARQSVLDFLREELGFTGTKKGCDMGHCGACIVHVNGKRVNACLTLAIDQQDSQVVTIEGLVKGEQLHP
ncbi:MAG: (2Fe-2S)-binding protein, partial [Chitinophagaceae bacterium]